MVIGFWQEYSADERMDSLRALSSPSATVLRNGNTPVIPNAELVPGDIVLLKKGDSIPDDLRIFEATNLSCDEFSPTGEAVLVEKTVRTTPSFLEPKREPLPKTKSI
ncbi:hypothetical protein VUR80DRAFT_7844 [Thermomyces stellatus]